MRKAAYHCLANQVPVETACHVIRSVLKEISATMVDCLPNPTTENQFAYELGVISDLQVGEVLVKPTRQDSRISRESHGFWQFLQTHGRETQCSRIFVDGEYNLFRYFYFSPMICTDIS